MSAPLVENWVEDGTLEASEAVLTAADEYALAHHRTAPCLRATELDHGTLLRPVRLASRAYWALATALAWHGLRDEPQRLMELGATAYRALMIGAWDMAAGAVLRLGGTTLLLALGYCPLGRLAFARPLRRFYVRLSRQLETKTCAIGQVFRSLAMSVISRQGLMSVSAATLLPLLQAALPHGQGLVWGLRLLLASMTTTAFITVLWPSHIVPGNPFRPEPHFALAHPRHPAGQRIGVLVAHLGTTTSPAPRDVGRFLSEFLSDRRVVEINPWVWRSILNGLIVPLRKYSSGRLYQRLFDTVTEANGASPLLHYTTRFANNLQAALGDRFAVAVGMRYGEPSLASALHELKAAGCQQIVLLPKNPQYSSTTTGSIYDAVFAELQRERNVPTLRVVRPYFEHPQYIESLARVTRAFLDRHEPVDKVIMSFHSIPERYYLSGDPYPYHCEATAAALAAALQLKPEQWVLTYQSVFGKDPWLRPATDATVAWLAQTGVQRVAVVCPGFLTDCLESVDENGTENRNIFLEHGGQDLLLVPCLNDEQGWCAGAAQLVREEAAGWLCSSGLLTLSGIVAITRR